MAENTAAQATGTAPEPAPTATQQPTQAEAADIDNLDGVWAGNTAQGEVIQFVVADGGLGELSIGFQVAGCEGLSPVQTAGTGAVVQLDGNTFEYESAIGFFNVSGNFTSATTAEGTLEIFCEEGLTTTWSAALGGQAVSAPSDSELALLPTLELPEDMFSTEIGVSGIDEYTAIEAAEGNWLLIRNLSESVLPIPSGWNGVSTPNGGTYTFGPSPEVVNYFLSMGVYCGTEASIEDQIQDLEEEINALPQGELLGVVLTEERTAHIRYRAYYETQNDLFDLLFFLSLRTGDCPYQVVGGARHGNWATFYPVLREIVARWYTLSGEQIGINLPVSMD